jgi:hypothetical protein
MKICVLDGVVRLDFLQKSMMVKRSRGSCRGELHVRLRAGTITQNSARHPNAREAAAKDLIPYAVLS